MVDDIEKLIDAVKQDDVVVVYELLHEDNDILQNDMSLVECFQHVNSIEVVQLLFEYIEFDRVKFSVNSLYMMSLINFAIMHGKNIDIITEIIKIGEDINAFDNRNRTPLIESLVSYRDVNFIEKLILMGADLNQCNSYFRSPLHFAYKKDIAALLLKYGAYINSKDENGQTPLLRALELNREKEMIVELIEGGANLQCVDQNGNTVLHLTNDPGLYYYFVRNNAAPLNGKNKKDQTPLMKAVKEHKNINLIKTILESGGCPNALDSNNNTPLHYAYNGELVNLLVSYGGNINAKNKYNQIPFYTIFHHRPITFSFGFNSAEAILKHTLLCNSSEIPSDNSSSEVVGASNFRILTEVCKTELSKMKEHEIIKNMSFYDFCMFKKTKYNKVIKISDGKYLHTKDEIKQLFPNFYDIILLKMERNELELRRHNLSKRLNRICFKNKPTDEFLLYDSKIDSTVDDTLNKITDNLSNELFVSIPKSENISSDTGASRKQSSAENTETVELDYDCLCCVSRYLNYNHLSNLFLASML